MNDISTVHHAGDFFSRDPMERENYPAKAISATQCTVKDFDQKETVDGQRMPKQSLKQTKFEKSNFI